MTQKEKDKIIKKIERKIKIEEDTEFGSITYDTCLKLIEFIKKL